MISKKTKDKITTYLLTIIFVMLLVSFFGALISISQYVSKGEDNELINEHIGITKHLIEDVNEVELSVNKLTQSETLKDQKTYNSFKGIENLIEASSVNVKSQKQGMLTLIFDTQVQKIDNIFYLEYTEKSPLKLDDIVVFKTENKDIQYGKSFIQENDEVGVYLDKTQEITFVKKDKILGKFIMEFNKELTN